KKGFKKMVIKLPYGSSGKGLKIINNEVQFQRLVNYLKRHCKEKVFLLIEGWHNIKRSLNSQFIIGNYETKLLSITEQIINSDGVYFGTNYTPHYKDELLKNYKKQVYEISNLIQDLGYRGIIGIDSIQDQDNIIYPTIEINARFTQVTYLLPLVSKLSKDYKFIESRIFRMNFSQKVSFLDIKRTLDRLFKKANDLDYLIYTYAHTHHGQRNYYKLFILFMGNTQECLKGIIEDVKGMEQNSVAK
ncbi:ATP-grasp domain-containing protein, partial [Priestia megaterium]|uniref:ATP-grasp domain-containing protein n=1 Tax=Priestia megaterium TaxID=1404 RepID=UPI002E247051